MNHYQTSSSLTCIAHPTYKIDRCQRTWALRGQLGSVFYYQPDTEKENFPSPHPGHNRVVLKIISCLKATHRNQPSRPPKGWECRWSWDSPQTANYSPFIRTAVSSVLMRNKTVVERDFADDTSSSAESGNGEKCEKISLFTWLLWNIKIRDPNNLKHIPGLVNVLTLLFVIVKCVSWMIHH